MLNKIKLNWKAGLTVAMINIPLSISLAVASWATPMQWIITWVWAWFIASFFASSHYNVFWVAWSLTSILLGFILLHPNNWVLLLPLIAIFSWFFMLLVYIFKLTKYITLIPSTALHGFLISVWITIALWQLSWAFWLNDPALNIKQHNEIALNVYELFKNIWSTNIMSFITFILWLTFLVSFKKYFPKFPAVILLTIIGIIIWIFVDKWLIPNMLLLVTKFPNLTFSLVDFSFYTKINIDSFENFISIIKWIFSISIVVAIIAIIETIISARIAEKITKVKFNKDKEVLWLALSNIWTWLVWWLPNTAVFVRTSLNINSWATHRTSAFLIALFTLLISALLFNWAFKYLPFSIISAILMNIAIWLIDIWLLKKLYSIEKQAFFITLITTFFSVFWEPTYGILIWTAITLIIYIGKITNSDAYVTVFREWWHREKISLTKYTHSQHHEDVLLTKFSLWLNYLNIETNIALIEKLNHNQKLIISLAHMWNIDIDWIEAIDEMIWVLNNNWIEVYISWIEDIENSFISKIHNYKFLIDNNKIYTSSSEILEKLT